MIIYCWGEVHLIVSILASIANLLGHEKSLSARADGVGLRSKTVLSTASLNQMSRGVYLVFVSEE